MLLVEKYRSVVTERVVGKIRADHDETGHWYILPTGKREASVTTKLILDKPHLIKWAIRLAFEWMEVEERWKKLNPSNRDEYLQGATLAHTEERDTAGSIGHQAHAVLEKYLEDWILKGKPAEDIKTFIPEGSHYKVFGACRSAEAGFKEYKIIPIASEILVGHEKIRKNGDTVYSGAGTLDAIMFNTETKKLELWDFKTSNQVSDPYAMQVAAYKEFFEKMTGLKISKCRVLQIDKYSDKYLCYNVNDTKNAFKAFVAISSVYDWLHNGRLKLTKDKEIVTL